MINVAQAGYGYWGRNLFRAFLSVKNAKMALCCDSNPKALDELRAAHPSIEICSDFADILNRKNIDAVIIATPAGLHYEQAKASLEAGKHVLVEKPLALRSAEARELAEFAEKVNRILMVGHTFLYNDAVRYAKQKIESGELGEIYYAYFTRLNLGRVRQDVDALWNLAPHDVSIAQYWFGEKPNNVDSAGICCLQKGIDDAAFMTMRYPSGRLVHIHVSWLAPHRVRQAVIVGSKKMLMFDDTSPDQRIVIYDKGIDRKDVPDAAAGQPFACFAQYTLIQRAGDMVIPKISYREPLQVELNEFIECVRIGKKPLADGWNGLEVVEILESAQDNKKGE